MQRGESSEEKASFRKRRGRFIVLSIIQHILFPLFRRRPQRGRCPKIPYVQPSLCFKGPQQAPQGRTYGLMYVMSCRRDGRTLVCQVLQDRRTDVYQVRQYRRTDVYQVRQYRRMDVCQVVKDSRTDVCQVLQDRRMDVC